MAYGCRPSKPVESQKKFKLQWKNHTLPGIRTRNLWLVVITNAPLGQFDIYVCFRDADFFGYPELNTV
jgi:hypothetical protein